MFEQISGYCILARLMYSLDPRRTQKSQKRAMQMSWKRVMGKVQHRQGCDHKGLWGHVMDVYLYSTSGVKSPMGWHGLVCPSKQALSLLCNKKGVY